MFFYRTPLETINFLRVTLFTRQRCFAFRRVFTCDSLHATFVVLFAFQAIEIADVRFLGNPEGILYQKFATVAEYPNPLSEDTESVWNVSVVTGISVGTVT